MVKRLLLSAVLTTTALVAAGTLAACSSNSPATAAGGPAAFGAPTAAAPGDPPPAGGAASGCTGDVTSSFCATAHVTGAVSYDGRLSGAVPGSQDPISLTCSDWAAKGNTGSGLQMLLTNEADQADEVHAHVSADYHGAGTYPLTNDDETFFVGDKTFQLIPSEGGKGTIQVNPDGSGVVTLDGWGDSADGHISGSITFSCGSVRDS